MEMVQHGGSDVKVSIEWGISSLEGYEPTTQCESWRENITYHTIGE